MTCTCRGKSAFEWASCNCPSVFSTDPKFTYGASTGRTMGQIATESVEAFEDRTGRSLGTVGNISAKATKAIEQRQARLRIERQGKKS